MNKEELYKLALSDVPKYSLLNEIFAIRDKNIETVDYTIGVNGFISLDVLNKYINAINSWNELKDWLENIDDRDMGIFNLFILAIKDKMQEIESRE